MAGAQNAVATLVQPGTFTKILESPEETLVKFTDYTERFEEWMAITGMAGLGDYEKWALLSAVGGQDMRNLLKHESGVEWRRQDYVAAVAYQAAIEPDPTANPVIVGQPEITLCIIK